MAVFFKRKDRGNDRAAEAPSPPPSIVASTQTPPLDPALEARALEKGREFLKYAQAGKSNFLSKGFWSDKLMDWSMKDEAFKVQLFRFVDAFPMLRTPDQVHEHLTDYLSQPGVTPPPGFELGVKAGGLAKGLMTRTFSNQITSMARKFIAGTDAASALPQLEGLWKNGLAFSVDLLGEACVSSEEAGQYQEKYRDLVENLPEQVASWASNPVLESDHLGPIPRTNVSIKISSLFANTDPIDFEGSVRGLEEAVMPLLESAKRHNVFINFDMEQFALKEITLELFMRCCEKIDFNAGIAMQAYLRSGDDDARKLIEWSKRTGRQVSVRLVKGAYWDYETIHAEQEGWPVPVWSHKPDTDACFERMSAAFIDSTPKTSGEGGIKLALGSHNARSIGTALAQLEKADLPTNALELQMLYGMGPELKTAAVEMGLRLREYVPVGEMIPGMAYLVRRLLENTSNESWLRAGFLDNASEDDLLRSPHRTYETDPGIDRITQAPERHKLSAGVEGIGDGRPFFTESMRDFSEASVRVAFTNAVRDARVPQVANDSTVEQAEQAISALHDYSRTWADTPYRDRAEVLIKAARIMQDRRDELSGIVIKENGKPWRDADAEVCEAIDFCEFYAREGQALFTPRRLGNFIGEIDETWNQPRGVAAVISPWNFPLAICAGMCTAALVTGNVVALKPAEQTPGIAKVLVDILREAGLPRQALSFLPGLGETVGAAIVRDPRVSLIAFTGSRAVGLDIIKAAGNTPESQNHVKKVVCEMGGKNAIIIDASADLDEAVLGVRQSAFGFSGQKCSACSRAIVVESAHDHFLERLVESTKTLVVGNPVNPGTDVGPVIDEEAAGKITSFIEEGGREGTIQCRLPIPEGLEQEVGLPYVGPTIVSGISADDRLATEEIFGPVLSVIRVKDFEEALQVANATQYKLTGGVYSRKPSHLDQARREFRVGNLYLNRGITGALVGRQPFGGFGMSGVGSKAGGLEYLLQFVEPRACSENAMRRGFAPGL